MLKKLIFTVVASFLTFTLLISHETFASGNVAPMQYEEKSGEIGINDTRRGDAGESWIYLTWVRSMTSQAAFGAKSTVGAMANVTWTITYSDGTLKSGTNFPFSSDWKGTDVKSWSSSGVKSATLSGFAITVRGDVLVLLEPTDYVYIY